MSIPRTIVSTCVVIRLLTSTALAVNIETVPVGDPGNAADSRYGGYGSVSYSYCIGKYEVTTGQYTEFLNAVAATDTYGLYNAEMWSSDYGCKIQRSGSSGSHRYFVAAEWANRPVNYVSWGDAARFANWLHNGQPSAPQGLTSTEDGAYYLNGATSDADLIAVTRKANWKWAIPKEDEWYKAAYYKGGSANAGYWDYPTSTDGTPSNLLIDPDPGNCANSFRSGYTIGSPYYRTEVGEFENSDSPYGTFDQGGNVSEWNEAVFYGPFRGLRGGSFHYYNGDGLLASNRNNINPSYEYGYFGFRVSHIPEPSSIALLVLGVAAMLARSRSQ